MRNAFADEMTQLASKEPALTLLSGDIGNRLFDRFKETAPERFFNCGVAEANMTGVAAGMALSGLRPVTYTITPFNTSRCFEQIRVDICYQNLPVIIVGVGAGLSYAALGATHHACEDIAILRSLPNMTILCPGDAMEVRAAVRAALRHNGPVYIRLGKKNEPVIHATPPELEIGKGLKVRPGEDICLLSTGNLLPTAINTAELLAKQQFSCQVISLHTIKPLDHTLLEQCFKNFPLVATLEEHSLIGGLYSAVCEWKNQHLDGQYNDRQYNDRQHNRVARLIPFGTPDRFLSACGNQSSARQFVGLEASQIADTLTSELLSLRHQAN